MKNLKNIKKDKAEKNAKTAKTSKLDAASEADKAKAKAQAIANDAANFNANRVTLAQVKTIIDSQSSLNVKALEVMALLRDEQRLPEYKDWLKDAFDRAFEAECDAATARCDHANAVIEHLRTQSAAIWFYERILPILERAFKLNQLDDWEIFNARRHLDEARAQFDADCKNFRYLFGSDPGVSRKS